MGLVDSKIYKSLEFIMTFFVLNLIWLIMCLPIFTIFPATTAMFGVVREWKRHGDTPVLATFFRILKENFIQSFIVGSLWTGAAILLLVDFMFTNQLTSDIKYLLFTFFFGLTLFFILSTVVIFPVLAHYKVTAITAIKKALILSIRYLPNTLLSLVVLSVIIALCFYFPAATLLAFSIGAYLIYSIAELGFKKFGRMEVSNRL
ncbi:hypothetical protein J14TS2_18740 [Bacillus sp. J14TS2]|uniref:YesL family protein n=1 Tax=Bacillus sp. J14TS2 TaxID=2807188 RepID=UPI001B180D99|nr:DUF624 domain-containing protein [Bacillus sp. J14TS2]GIN71399.1 hypothetical protein J14TS2_18740 [Bacillus sp. J14TS2]